MHTDQESLIKNLPIAFSFRDNGRDAAIDISPTCRAQESSFWGGNVAVAEHSEVARRLTPLECERLQGMPDSWTLIPDAKDAHRYKAIGNSMAVPVMRWIGEGIAAVNLE
jgi:DNA (cytosine-5)-methyltransferase 1